MVRNKAAWTLERGAKVVNGGDAVRFSVWAPKTERVSVILAGRARAGVPLQHHGKGVFEGTIRGLRAGDDYLFQLGDGRPLPDPVSRWQPRGVHEASRVVDPAAFRWTDRRWTGVEVNDLVIYELHVGTFSEAGTFAGVADHLAELARLGVTAIEIMPVAQFPGERNWGYDGVFPYAPQHSYGGPDGLRRLVNAAHEAGLAVVLDVVYNHLGPEGNYLGEYGPYFSGTYTTPWGHPVNFDGADSDEVRRYVIDNALYWITEFHIDALRLDAVHAIFDFSARHILEELGDAVHEQGRVLGRRTLVIAESDLNDPRLLRDRERGGYELDAQWSDDFHHAVHVALTGERRGYYADFGGVEPVARALRDRFVYDGRYSAFRRKRRGAPALDVPSQRFVVAIQNHDQVGNRARGERLSTLVSPAQLKLAAATVLMSPYVPLLFMGEEYGERNPFLYFVSHGEQKLAEAVRRGRREEFASFGWGDDVPDPNDAQTFRRSKLDRTLSAVGAHARLYALYRDLLRARKEERALRPGDSRIHVWFDEVEETVAMELVPEQGAPLLAVFNFAAEDREARVPSVSGGTWRLRLTTEDERYGGRCAPPCELICDSRGELFVPASAHSASLYRRANG
jgi:maltooligosyltrehalose trehalohydrolase